jgi:hypothetical protein
MAVTPGHRTIALIACASAKRSVAAPAAEMYVSSLFTKARMYAEEHASAWYVLSAKHGLVDPASVIEPYDVTLNTMGARERREWAALVSRQLEGVVGSGDRAIVLAGVRYREGVVDGLRARGVRVEIPLEGLRIGEQLAWLTRAAEAAT